GKHLQRQGAHQRLLGSEVVVERGLGHVRGLSHRRHREVLHAARHQQLARSPQHVAAAIAVPALLAEQPPLLARRGARLRALHSQEKACSIAWTPPLSRTSPWQTITRSKGRASRLSNEAFSAARS